MNPLERKLEKTREAKTRQKVRGGLASLIVAKVLQGLKEKISKGQDISNRDIAEVLRPIVDNKIDFNNRLFQQLAFKDMGDLLDDVTPLIYRGIGQAKTKATQEKIT